MKKKKKQKTIISSIRLTHSSFSAVNNLKLVPVSSTKYKLNPSAAIAEIKCRFVFCCCVSPKNQFT